MSEPSASVDLDRAGITAREREVLTLLGERLTNAEIGERLFISVRTVESHVSALLTKLGVRSRRDLAQFAGAARRRGFPVPGTSLIGRQDQLTEIRQRLVDNRLVTLTGVAGAGKTRLALEVGNRLASEFADGAVFVDLVPVTDSDLVAGAVASALAATGEVRATIDEVAGYLAARELLVVVDNCEHVLRGAAELVEQVLSASAQVKVLTTSRQAFAMTGEWVYNVPPLGLPDGRQPAAEAESVRLMVERTEAVRPGLDLLGAHLDAVVDICLLLDGLPLAIELAAVQMAHLTPADLAARLDDRFRLLVSRSNSTTGKSTTLRAAMEWSYELLTPEEKALFNRLGVFAGSFSLEAAESMFGDGQIGSSEISDLVSALVWRSWLLPLADSDSSRYRLLETIRAFALEQLDAEGLSQQTWQNLARWSLGLVETAAPHLVRVDASDWLARIDRELGNLRAALRWAVGSGQADVASRMVVSLWRYWHMRGNVEEGRRWASDALAISGEDPLIRVRILEAAGGLAYWDGDMGRSREYYEEALKLLRRYGEEVEIANALYNAAFSYGFGGHTDRGLEYAESARKIFQHLDDEAGVAKCLWAWGAVAHRARREKEARVAYEKALPIYKRLDDTFSLAWAHRMLGTTLLRLGELEEARFHITEGLRLFDAAGDVSGMILNLRDFAQLALYTNQPERALTLAGALTAMEEESGLRLLEGFSEQLEGVEDVRIELGPDRADELLERGRNMSKMQAVRYALTEASVA